VIGGVSKSPLNALEVMNELRRMAREGQKLCYNDGRAVQVDNRQTRVERA